MIEQRPVDNDVLALAREVVGVLKAEGYEPLLIGAVAMAAHGYARNTGDTDFALAIPPEKLGELVSKLPGSTEFQPPEGSDPLGGVLTTRRGDYTVQLVNFDNPPAGGFPRLVQEALARSTSSQMGAHLPTIEDLILFKAYAGGPKSRNDVAELLVRTKPDLDRLRQLAKSYRIERELEYVLDEQ